MEYSETFKTLLSIAIPEKLNQQLLAYLIREDGDEDLCFALYRPSHGTDRSTALINEIIFPIDGDRQRHGNVSFNKQYFSRVTKIALKKNCGIVLIHSHPGPGWQGMSPDDMAAETKWAPPSITLTGLPLVGLTAGSDGTWSGRSWSYSNGSYKRQWAYSIRAVGSKLNVNFNDSIVPKSKYKEEFKRTITVWGNENHQLLTRLNIGIIGLGSVGSIVAESLARMGFQNFVLIDFDEVQRHNLDRLLGATVKDISKLKVNVAKRQILKAGTADSLCVQAIPFSVAEQAGYKSALDCDILFSCVDRPRARHVLNNIAYNHLIPIIDGGIRVRMPNGIFDGVDWQLQTVGPGKPCLRCLNIYDPADVSLEVEGKLDDPSYLDTLPSDHPYKMNENIFTFSMNLASLEIFHLIDLVTNIGNIENFGKQRFRYQQGIISHYHDDQCKARCDYAANIAMGDLYIVTGTDISAEAARARQKKNNHRIRQFFSKGINAIIKE